MLAPYIVSGWAHTLNEIICTVIKSFVSAHIDRNLANVEEVIEPRDDRTKPNPRVTFENSHKFLRNQTVKQIEEDVEKMKEDAQRTAAIANFHTGPRNGHTDSCSKGSQYNGKCKVCRFAMPRREMSECTLQEIEMRSGHKYFSFICASYVFTSSYVMFTLQVTTSHQYENHDLTLHSRNQSTLSRVAAFAIHHNHLITSHSNRQMTVASRWISNAPRMTFATPSSPHWSVHSYDAIIVQLL